MALKKRKDGRYEKGVTIDGKVVHFYGKTQREVNEKIMAYRRKKQNGPLFSELLDEYETQYLEEHPSNRRYIKAHIKRLSEFFKGKYRKELKPKDFTGLFLAMYPLSYKTMSNCRMVASGRYVYGMAVLGLENNPVELSRLPSFRTKGHREPPTPEEIEKIKQYHDTEEDLFMLVRLYTGLRRGEILALQYKDIDREHDLINVTKSVWHDPNDPKLKEPKTAAGVRQVVLLKPLKDALPKGPANDFIFGGKQPWTAHKTQRALERYERIHGIKVTPHQLRHRYATILYEAGIDDRMAMELLGHANISTTRNVYTHISTRKKEARTRTLNAFLNSSEIRQNEEKP